MNILKQAAYAAYPFLLVGSLSGCPKPVQPVQPPPATQATRDPAVDELAEETMKRYGVEVDLSKVTGANAGGGLEVKLDLSTPQSTYSKERVSPTGTSDDPYKTSVETFLRAAETNNYDLARRVSQIGESDFRHFVEEMKRPETYTLDPKRETQGLRRVSYVTVTWCSPSGSKKKGYFEFKADGKISDLSPVNPEILDPAERK